MQLLAVESMDNPELSIYKVLRDNVLSADQSFIADSPKVVNLLLETEIEVKSILATQEYYDSFKDLIQRKKIPNLYLATKEQMQSIVGHKIHHNCMMHGIRPRPSDFEDLGNEVIMLDEITSTENIGAIARSAAALGVDSYVLPKQGPHPYGRRALRVSMGYMSHLKSYLYDDIKETIKAFQKRAYKVYAAEVADDAIALSDLVPSQKWVLIMGHEGKGISQDILDLCDACVQIEMAAEVKSFNVGVAASILMYQFQNRAKI